MVPISVDSNIAGTPTYTATYVGTSECLYSVSVMPMSAGQYELRGLVNGEEVSNSPILQRISGENAAVDPLKTEFGQTTALFTTGNSYMVSFVLKDVAGSDIPSFDGTGLTVRGRLERAKTFVSNSPFLCSGREDYSWTIGCFPDQVDGSFGFSYVDDISVGNAEKTFSDLSAFEFDSTGGRSVLEVTFDTTVYGGMHSLSVWIGDSLLTGSPVDILVRPSSSATVSPQMSLVQIAPGATDNYFEDTDILARVLLRDAHGNPLPNVAGAVVIMVITPQPSSTPFTFPCTYVTGKYYECLGWTSTPGTNVLTITVNGVSPSVTSGGPPEVDGCYATSTCGTPECPCMQRRDPFSVTFNVLTTPYGV
jgi:hypothetical protein